jgi:hypothetical protein
LIFKMRPHSFPSLGPKSGIPKFTIQDTSSLHNLIPISLQSYQRPPLFSKVEVKINYESRPWIWNC